MSEALVMKSLDIDDAIAFLRRMYDIRPEAPEVQVFIRAAENRRIAAAASQAEYDYRAFDKEGRAHLPYYVSWECWECNIYPTSLA